jgi:Arc/MetJ family transcription regulator
MRTNIVIDDKLMKAAMRATGLKTKRETVEEALKALIRWRSRRDLAAAYGKFRWIGDLDTMRRD